MTNSSQISLTLHTHYLSRLVTASSGMYFSLGALADVMVEEGKDDAGEKCGEGHGLVAARRSSQSRGSHLHGTLRPRAARLYIGMEHVAWPLNRRPVVPKLRLR